MSHILNVTYDEKPCYNIYIESDFNKFYEEISKFDIKNKKICIVTETNVAPNFLNEVESNLNKLAGKVCHFIFKAGEKQKNTDTINDIYECLIKEHFDRNDILIALGGGVTGDMTGFAAATYLRGIDFIQVPTSLLAQVDSSIGGKTGVDFKCYKNMVGAFKQPRMVYINTSTLKTLPTREYLSGFGEIIKHGFIKNNSYLNWLKANKDAILALDSNVVEEMIFESCKIKQDVVQRDPLEKGERALLNFGHTLGHAIEKSMNFTLLHGECVALGMCCALLISKAIGNISDEECDDAIKLIESFDLPIKLSVNLSIDEIMNAVFRDKKMDSGVIKFIILKDIGNAVIDKNISFETIRESVNILY